MTKNIYLSEIRTRSLSSSLIVVEKSLLELEDMLQNSNNSCCNVLIKDIDDEILSNNISAIRKAKRYICELSKKYGTQEEKLSLQRIINAKRAKIWETLTDALTEKSKGSGAIPPKYADEYDIDITRLLEMVNEIKY
ncbi:MAG TPA: hypothetical protein VJ963_12650 [Bacteroidales bacterium]|nr:hypothetical protein [Bacteroidales bacterium]